MTAAKNKTRNLKQGKWLPKRVLRLRKEHHNRKKNGKFFCTFKRSLKFFLFFACSLSKATWAVQNASSKPAGFSRLPGLMCSILGQVSTFDFFFFVMEETDAASCSFLRFKNSHSRRTLKVNCAWNSIHFEENGQGRRSLLRLAWIGCGGGLNPCNLC